MKNTTALLISLLLMAVAANASATQPNEVYNYYCAQCHGSDGKGNGPNVTKDFATDPRDFTKVEDMQKLSDEDIRNVILNGGVAVSKSSLMPAWSGTLSDEDVDGLVGVLRCISQSKTKL
ncbi:MAG: cytochrome C [Gammaproteobacteria bacterium]|nr:cytochrome C [Gammaproteobacteria bacterium]